MLPQRLATGATGVKLGEGLHEALVRACAVYTQPALVAIERSLALAVQCETMHGVNACI